MVVLDGKVGDGEERFVGVPKGAGAIDSTNRSAVRAQLRDSLRRTGKAVHALGVSAVGVAYDEAEYLIDLCTESDCAIEEATVLRGGHGDGQKEVVEVLVVLTSIAVVPSS
jgi:hypothetical protein